MKADEPRTLSDKSLQCVQEEFKRLCKKSRNHLVLEEMLKFQAKGATLPVDFCHLGVLWVLDRNHDGKVTLEDFYTLAELCWQRRHCYQTFEYTAQLQAYCSLQLWRALNSPDGEAAFVDWLVIIIIRTIHKLPFKTIENLIHQHFFGFTATITCRICNLLIENSPERRRFWRHGLQQYLSIDSIEALHQLFRIQELNGTDFQAFFDLLQRVGEEQKLMDLQDEEQDDWVPLGVVREFVAAACTGLSRLLVDICPVEELQRQPSNSINQNQHGNS